MAKKKNRDLVEEQGVGYIKVTAKVKKGAVTEWYTSKFGFASVYTTSDLRNAAGKIKEIVIRGLRNENPEAESITAATKIFHTACEYIIPPGNPQRNKTNF